MKRAAKKGIEKKARTSARKAEAADGHARTTRELTAAELQAQDQFVIRQAEWKRRRARGTADGSNANETSPLLKTTPESARSLRGARHAFRGRQTGIYGHGGPAMVGPTPVESGFLSSGVNLELIQNLPVGIALIWMQDPDDAKTWRIAAANKVARRIIGGPLLDFLLTRVAKGFPFQQKMEEIYQSILQRRSERDLHWIMCDIGGIRRTYSVTGFAAGSKCLGLLMQDVTAHREMRALFIENGIRYEEISKAIQTFLWKGDPETLQTRWVSNEAEKVLGYWPEHWYSMANFWLEHIDAQDREMVRRTMRKPDARFDYRMAAADRRTVWLHAVIRRGEDAMGRPELSGVMVNITARKVAEEAAQELSRKLLRSQDDERRHVARELHDSLGQYLSVLGMNVGTLSRTVPTLSEQQEAIFAETTDLLETCSRELRTLSYLMHPPMLDEVGLVPALEWYASGFSERSKIPVEMDAPRLKARLPKLVEMAFFRITQEALTNIYRHSRGKTAKIQLREDAGGVKLKIGDDGGGVDAHLLEGIASGNGGAKGVGIRGMRERMAEMGGTLHVISNKSGTTISAHLPRTASVFAKRTQDEQDATREATVTSAD